MDIPPGKGSRGGPSSPCPADLEGMRERLRAIADPVDFLANLIARSPVGFAIGTPEGRCFLVNQSFMDLFLVAPPPEYSILHDEILTELGLMPYIRRAFAGETVQPPTFWYDPRELKSIKVDVGRRVAISMSLFPLFGRDGKLQFVAMAYKDETEVTLARERLEKMNLTLEARVEARTRDLAAANEELEHFASRVSHDLRAPLRSIAGFTHILQQDQGARMGEEARGLLGRVAEAAGRMDKLIEGLLAFSRLGSRRLDMRDVSSAEMVHQALEDLAGDRERNPAEIVLGELPSCRADPLLLKQVFVNLLGNALKFTRGRHPARVEVGSRPESGHRVWFVRDNGSGFDMASAGALFGVFERLHDPREYEGTGIGLALARRIVEKHGGRIWAQASPDHGAVFSFTLEGNPPVSPPRPD